MITRTLTLLGLAAVCLTGMFSGDGTAEAVTTTGAKIAFETVRQDDKSHGIYVTDAGGGAGTRLTPPQAPLDGQPVYSPDGSRIAFFGSRDTPNWQIYVMNSDGTNVTRVTRSPHLDASPSWSPDGTQIAFDRTTADDNIDIYVIGVDGSGEKQLTSDPQREAFPAWSPDGTKIAFEMSRDGGSDIHVMNADGSGAAPITNGSGYNMVPDWSPSGKRIVYASGSENNLDIWVMRADGSGKQRLTSAGGHDNMPDWSHDGSKIAFSSDRSGLVDVWIMGADGENEKRLFGGPDYDIFPEWQPPQCTVGTVIDGDTFTCTDGTTVDLLQIDAPELSACGGEWARAALANIFLTPGRTVALSFDDVTSSGAVLAAPIIRGTDGVAYNISIVMVYVGLAKAAVVGAGNSKYLNWANGSQGWAQAAQWNMWAPGKPFTGGC